MTAPLSANHVGLPPPFQMDLVDAERPVGWIRRDRVGFRGFADELEAAHAAWVAHRTLARRLARTHGTRPPPIDVEPLALHREPDREAILAGGRPIAELVRPGDESRPGLHSSFGFEIRVPPPVDELGLRSMAHLIYRTLRKSGIRWALWRPASPPALQQASSARKVARAVARANARNGAARNAAARARPPERWALPTLAWLRPRRRRLAQ